MSEAPAPTDPDRYLSVHDGPEVETKVKGSRFLGRVFRVADEREAEARLADIRKVYHDATHHCWAWRIGSPGANRERFDDDGEPSGTAGVPILGALKRGDLLDTLAVVTRYYGGTKLGTGGLVRAYAETAQKALDAAEQRPIWLFQRLQIEIGFDDLGTTESVLARAKDAILEVDRVFEPQPRVIVSVKRSRASTLRAALVEATAGRAGVRDVPAQSGEGGSA